MSSNTAARSSTRERILDVALDVFVELGFRGTSISEIERRVGLTAGTGSFYRHFSSKEVLLRAAVEREVERCMAESNEERSALQADERRGWFPVIAAQVLRDLRRFDRLFHLLLTDGERVPEVRHAVTTALKGSGAVAWVDDPMVVVGIAALVGYHVFGLMGEGTITMISQDDFITSLAELTANTNLFGDPPAS